MTQETAGAGPEAVAHGGPLGWTPGRCWLGCERTDVPVRWIGPAILSGPDGVLKPDLHACEECIGRVYAMALAELRRGRALPPGP